MPSTAVVADTTSYLPPELIGEHDIHLVSLYVGTRGRAAARSRRSATCTDFYERLRISDQTVTTSQPSVGDFIAVYEPLLAEGREIVSIHLSAGISGTYESAMQARERLTAERQGRGADRRLRLADRLRRDGADDPRRRPRRRAGRERGGGDGSAREARREELKIWFAVDTLDYLRRGGRIGAARAWIGTTLKIKPILTLEEEITPIERVRTRAPSLRADGRLRPPAPRGRRRCLGRPARPGPGDRRAPGRGAAGRSSAETRSSPPRSAR